MKFIEIALSDKVFRIIVMLGFISLIAGQWISMWRCKEFIRRLHIEVNNGVMSILLRQNKALNEIKNAIVAVRAIETFIKKRNR